MREGADEPEDAGDARRPWREGPAGGAPGRWGPLDDDELLHAIETQAGGPEDDEWLLEVVASQRHFFIRQEAAKRVRERSRLFQFEDDRHVGQILVRHLTRREDVTYLERLAARSRYVEVRTAAQLQLARVWAALDGPRPGVQREATVREPPRQPEPPSAAGPGQAQPSSPASPQPEVDAEPEGVDASLLAWAAHFLVEQVWGHLGTTATRELLRRTQRELAPRQPTLDLFTITDEARVASELAPSARLPREAVRDVAAWMTAFRQAASAVAPAVSAASVRGTTALMADALREAGFYAACDAAEGARP